MNQCVGKPHMQVSCLFPTSFSGLMTSPCHGLIDAGAQDGTVGLWHFQRWTLCLAMKFRLQFVFHELLRLCEAGGIGGQARIIGICGIPSRIGGPKLIQFALICTKMRAEQSQAVGAAVSCLSVLSVLNVASLATWFGIISPSQMWEQSSSRSNLVPRLSYNFNPIQHLICLRA